MLRSTLLLALLAIFGLLSAPILRAQVDWTEHPASPVLEPGAGWDQGGLIAPSVVQEGDTLKMWYTGYVSLADPSSIAIGYAWSTDGVSWTQHPGNPVMTDRPGEWDHPGVASPIVIQDGDTYKMWYGAGGCPDDMSIGYATSTDGISWERQPAPVMERGPPGEWNVDFLSPGGVIKEGGLFKMWFWSGTGTVCSNTPDTQASTGYATSPDGITWTLYDDPATTDPPYQLSDPVLEHGPPGAWDFNYAISSHVLPSATGYELWYAGRLSSEQHIGYATSSDGIHWTKYEDNPVFEAPAWAFGGLLSPSVLREGDTYHMWFQGWQGGGSASFGYATALRTVATEPPAPPTWGELRPPHPNPTTAGTSITFRLAESEYANLAIFDLLGREVIRLADGWRPAGMNTITWDGNDANGRRVATGVYVVRMEAGGAVQTQRVTLLK